MANMLKALKPHSDRRLPTILRAAENGDLELVKMVCKNGTEINSVDKNGNSALMIATARGDLRMVRWLCENGADVNLRSADGSTAVMKADRLGNKDIALLLGRHGAHVNIGDKNGKSPLLQPAIGASYPCSGKLFVAKPMPTQPVEDDDNRSELSSQGPLTPPFSPFFATSALEIPTSMAHATLVTNELGATSSGNVHSEETGGSYQRNDDEELTIPKQLYTEDETSVKQTYTAEEDQTFVKQRDNDSEETEDEERVDLDDDNDEEDSEEEDEEKPC